MKAAAEKSPTTTPTPATRTSGQPFFAKAGGGNFFEPAAAPPVQAKLTVNKPGDKFEQEADRMADKVMRMPAPDEKLQRAPDDKLQKKEEDKLQKAPAPAEKLQRAEPKDDKIQQKEDDKLQKKEGDEKIRSKEDDKLQRTGDDAPAVGPGIQAVIQGKMAGGQPLAADVRSHMEPRFGADFSRVRIHDDAESAGLSAQLGARAFAYRNHLFFARNQYQPGTAEGKQLLAHELAHTIQQGHAPMQAAGAAPSGQPATSAIQRAPAPAGSALATSSEVVDVSGTVFSPSEKVREEIAAQDRKGLSVRVVAKGLTGEGTVKVRGDRAKNYDSIGRGAMPLLNPWAQQLGGLFVNFNITNSEIKNGSASIKPAGESKKDWFEAIQKNAALLGGVGLKINGLPKPVNTFENGKLLLGVTDVPVEVGGFLQARFSFTLENLNTPKIAAAAQVSVQGMAKGELKLDNTQGKLAGEITLAITLKAFSGTANVKYNPDGTIDIAGSGAYNSDKLSGEVKFVATDLEAANKFAKDAIAAAGGKENVQSAGPPAPVPLPAAGKKNRALAATGQLVFNLTTWFAGTVFVVVDGKGNLTVIGKIAPPAEIELFKQRDWDKELIKFEAKAYYGIPVVGNLNLFANISLHALAKLGPAKINNIEILGTYSTDPEIQKSIQISASLNISAYAGLRLRAEGGAGVEIVEHNLKFGVGLNADIGVKAYVDARPAIGYRDPGEFYVSGTLEMVAQPMLGLGGDFFIQLETPWWSPLSDDKWTWPLFSKEWPLGDPIGLSAVVKDYVLGSGKAPEIELKKPEFDPSKFMTSMVDKTLPEKSGGAAPGQGTFKEDGSVPKPTIPPKKPAPKAAGPKPAAKKGAPPKGGKSAAPDPKGAKEQANAKALKDAAAKLQLLKGQPPFTRAALNQALAKIKAQVSGADFEVQAKGANWFVTPKAGGKAGKQGVALAAKDQGDARTEEQKKQDLLKALKEANAFLNDENFGEEEVKEKLPTIKDKYKLNKLVLVSDSETETETTVHIHGEVNPVDDTGKKKKPKKLPVKTGDKVQVMHDGDWSVDYLKITAQANQYKCEASGKIDKNQISKTLLSKDYLKLWRKYNPYKTGEAWEAIKTLNDWASSYKDASQTLSYRKHGRFNVPPGKNWHHIHEQSNNGPNTVENLALTDAGLNTGFLNAYFRIARPGTGGLPLRLFLAGKDHATHMMWGLQAIAAAGKSLVRGKDEGRGTYNEVQ